MHLKLCKPLVWASCRTSKVFCTLQLCISPAALAKQINCTKDHILKVNCSLNYSVLFLSLFKGNYNNYLAGEQILKEIFIFSLIIYRHYHLVGISSPSPSQISSTIMSSVNQVSWNVVLHYLWLDFAVRLVRNSSLLIKQYNHSLFWNRMDKVMCSDVLNKNN